jgi:hypothetical protein
VPPQVDIEPPQAEGSEEAVTLCWDDLDMPEDDGDVVVFHRNWEAEGRKALMDLQVGDTLTGEVIFRHLYHGALVDVGAEFDGCVLCVAASAHACQCLTLFPLHLSVSSW